MDKEKKCEHNWEDQGKGYFIGSNKLFFHDDASMTSELHHYKCNNCDEDIYKKPDQI